jgi:hypothetical protein
VFTARYALSPYIKQTRFVFKELIMMPTTEETATRYKCSFADFRNAAEYWLFPYESPTFRYELEGVWEEVRPLYELLHAYVRRKLRDLYGPDKLSRKAPLPAHVLGKCHIPSCSRSPLVC